MHCQGPCSLRPCILRLYCISLLIFLDFHEWKLQNCKVPNAESGHRSCTKVCLSVLKCNVKLGRGWGRGSMLPVHEDDQDLILGQAAPLSISTHTHTQPNLLCCPTKASPGAAVVYAAPTPSPLSPANCWTGSSRTPLFCTVSPKSMQCFKRIDKKKSKLIFQVDIFSKKWIDLFFVCFLEEIEDTKKTFRNYLTFKLCPLFVIQ